MQAAREDPRLPQPAVDPRMPLAQRMLSSLSLAGWGTLRAVLAYDDPLVEDGRDLVGEPLRSLNEALESITKSYDVPSIDSLLFGLCA